MSDFDSNPFADPEERNPFGDPSITQATQNNRQAGLQDYNPFADQGTTQAGGFSSQQHATTVPAPQPAVMQPTVESPPAYSQTAAQSATADLQRKQEELERKAEELSRREQELERQAQFNAGIRENNFPPLPSWSPIKPCFYQDFALEIPLEFQKIVKLVYYTWIGYVLLLLINMIGALAAICVDVEYGTTFGVSLGYLVLFTPCSFVCWYRPVYKAFRSDSSFNFFLFFFIFFFQFCVLILFAIGIKDWGTCGFFNAMSMVTSNGGGHVFVGIMMILITLGFIVASVANFILLVKVHRIYRHTGASFQKAQEEFASGVMSNRTVQQTAASVGSAAAKNAFSGNQSGNRF